VLESSKMSLAECIFDINYQTAIRAGSPDVLSCFPTGLRQIQALVRSLILYWTHSAWRVATDLPVSKTEDMQLFTKISRETSLKMWLVARY
jgi:hypothetical protein